MSGHSRWSQIKHKKELSDRKRGQLFSKLAKLISVAAKDDPDPYANPKLKSVIEKAHSLNMPNENIERAIGKAQNAAPLQELTIEAMGPAGVSLIVSAITDNRNRTLAEIKNILAQYESKLTAPGSQLWRFDRLGLIRIPLVEETAASFAQDEVELQLIGSGAEEIKRTPNTLEIYTKPENLESVKSTAESLSLEVESAELEYIPKAPLEVIDDHIKTKLSKLFDTLDNHADVEAIYSNLSVNL
jgi:YebC/PmpR family DNA-binding regulatory protein